MVGEWTSVTTCKANEENPFICETKEIRSFENNRQRIELEVKASKKLEKKVKQSNDTW